MAKSKDIMHDRSHVERMLKDLAKILKIKKFKKINLEVMILSICWHDVWKAQKGHGGPVKTIYQQVMEGVFTAIIFRKEARKQGLDKDVTKRVAYAIRKHSQLQFLPTKTDEAKLLQDLDKIEKWHVGRALTAIDEYFAFTSDFMRFLFKVYMRMDKEQKLYFPALKGEFNKRKRSYFSTLGF